MQFYTFANRIYRIAGYFCGGFNSAFLRVHYGSAEIIPVENYSVQILIPQDIIPKTPVKMSDHYDHTLRVSAVTHTWLGVIITWIQYRYTMRVNITLAVCMNDHYIYVCEAYAWKIEKKRCQIKQAKVGF